jgi:hypothetical protein
MTVARIQDSVGKEVVEPIGDVLKRRAEKGTLFIHRYRPVVGYHWAVSISICGKDSFHKKGG